MHGMGPNWNAAERPNTVRPAPLPSRAPAGPDARTDAPPSRRVVSAASSCWRCGARVPEEAMFCQSCGANLTAATARPAQPAAVAPRARLIVIAQDGSAGHEYSIESGQIEIGRESPSVRLDGDVYACPRHARIYWKGDRFWVADLGSVNGVYARLTEPERLHHGDLLLVGLEVLRFELVAPGEATPPPAVERGTRLFGSPSSPRYARLVERTVEGITRNVFYLSKLITTLGRETGDVVFTDDPFMSRQHAALSRQEDGTFVVKDLGSSNGTFIAIRDERPLPDGGHVRIGQHLFRLKVDR
jgi:pSer/pThr/pTyr-binding forkhead associated (FHA) protein